MWFYLDDLQRASSQKLSNAKLHCNKVIFVVIIAKANNEVSKSWLIWNGRDKLAA